MHRRPRSLLLLCLIFLFPGCTEANRSPDKETMKHVKEELLRYESLPDDKKSIVNEYIGDAIAQGSVDDVNRHLWRGQDPNDTLGDETLLQNAIDWGSYDIAKLLIARGADCSVVTEDGRGILHLALTDNSIRILSKELIEMLLVKGVQVNKRSKSGVTPLMTYCQGSGLGGNSPSPAILSLLLQSGADIHDTDSDKFNALHHLCTQSAGTHGKAIALLVAAGIDPEDKNSFGETALHVAIRNANSSTAMILIENGSDIHAREGVGSTPLIFAAMQGNARVAQVLLEKGADVNVRNKNGMTPLIIAALESGSGGPLFGADFGNPADYSATVRILLAAGADRDAEFEGETALDIAESDGTWRNEEVKEALRAGR